MRKLAEYAVAALTMALGGGSLALFVWFLGSGAPRSGGARLSEPAVAAWNAALCLLFFVQHSVMVRRTFRARLGRVLPARAHRVVYTLASAAALIALVVLWRPSHIEIYALEGAARWPTGAMLLAAAALFFWGIGSLGEFDVFGIQAFLGRARGGAARPSELTIKGPYRLVRHPFYLAIILALWASPAVSLDRLLLNVLFSAWIVLGARLEERDLLAEFGEAYASYQRETPMLAPGPRSPRQRRWPGARP